MSSDPNDNFNNWMNNDPVRGDSKGVLPGGGGGDMGIDVHPDGVKKFSTQADGEAKNFTSSYQDGVTPLMAPSAKIGGSFMEAAHFSGRHGQAVQKNGMLSVDVFKGLLSLGQGARTIAINYINGDTTSAATMPQVLDAFDASAGNGLFDQGNGSGRPGQNGNDNPVSLPEPKPVEPGDFSNPNDPGFSQNIGLGDDANYTVPGAPDCQDIEMATPDSIIAVEQQFQDDLAHEDYEPAPYDPDDYR